MAIDKNIKLPQKFLEQYRRHIGIRLAGSLVLIAAAAFLCTVIDFSASRYPAMGVVMVIAVGIVLACVFFRLHTILFSAGWTGTITEIEAAHKLKSNINQRGKPSRKFIVTLTIDCGGKKPKTFELLPDDELHGAKSENKYYTYAPYKVGDTVVFLRGLKYPMRCGVETEDMLDVHFVCPFCGDINKAERDTCFKCGKFLVK